VFILGVVLGITQQCPSTIVIPRLAYHRLKQFYDCLSESLKYENWRIPDLQLLGLW